MRIISKYIQHMPKDTSCHQFCLGVSRVIAKHYKKKQLAHLSDHPEKRLTASCIIYSRLRREIWMIGDCQCLLIPEIAGQEAPKAEFFDNPKPDEQFLAEERASIIRCSGLPLDSFLKEDKARIAIIPHMLETMKNQNKTYAVLDGFPVAEQHIRFLTLDFNPWELVFASDGYPFLKPTLQESEQALEQQRLTDPLNIGTFKATKAFSLGNNSFDDRAYIRFKV